MDSESLFNSEFSGAGISACHGQFWRGGRTQRGPAQQHCSNWFRSQLHGAQSAVPAERALQNFTEVQISSVAAAVGVPVPSLASALSSRLV